MSFLPILRVPFTAAIGRVMPHFLATPLAIAAADVKITGLATRLLPKAPNIGRKWTGCGVGIEPLGSPIGAATIDPPISTMSGLTPKKAGAHITRSARLPTSTEPTWREIPWVIAGLMVYLAT